jgi:hypothetical protein
MGMHHQKWGDITRRGEDITRMGEDITRREEDITRGGKTSPERGRNLQKG